MALYKVLPIAIEDYLKTVDNKIPKTINSALSEIKTVKTFYTEVNSGRGFKSIKSELIIKLKNDHSLYKIIKNIEKERYNEPYEGIKEALKKSRTAIIWMKESEESGAQPTVFQIADGNTKILYSIADKKSELKLIFIFLTLLGFAYLGIYFRFRKPRRDVPKV